MKYVEHPARAGYVPTAHSRLPSDQFWRIDYSQVTLLSSFRTTRFGHGQNRTGLAPLRFLRDLAGATCCSIDLQTGCWRETQPGVGLREVQASSESHDTAGLEVVAAGHRHRQFGFLANVLTACLKTA